MRRIMAYIVIPLFITIVGGVAVVLVEHYLNTESEEILSIASEGNTLVITNNTDQVLYVRVGYAVVEGGATTYCYPTPTSATGGEDPLVGPHATMDFPPRHCNQNINGYKVWAFNNRHELVFEKSG